MKIIIENEMKKENRIKWKPIRKSYLGRVCCCCDTPITKQNFAVFGSWHYKRFGQGYTRVLCPDCSKKIGLSMPVWRDIFRGD